MEAGVKAIIQKIHTDAEQHGNERYMQIKNEIDEEINRENKFYNDEIEKRRDTLRKKNEHEFERLLERIGSRLNHELLTYQQELLDEIFDMAVRKLRGISDTDFLNMFKSAIKGLKGSFTLYIGELSEGKLNIRDIKQAVKGTGELTISLSSETIPFKSGFVIADNRVEYNCLFEDLIEDKKSERAASIFKEIFLEG